MVWLFWLHGSKSELTICGYSVSWASRPLIILFGEKGRAILEYSWHLSEIFVAKRSGTVLPGPLVEIGTSVGLSQGTYKNLVFKNYFSLDLRWIGWIHRLIWIVFTANYWIESLKIDELGWIRVKKLKRGDKYHTLNPHVTIWLNDIVLLSNFSRNHPHVDSNLQTPVLPSNSGHELPSGMGKPIHYCFAFFSLKYELWVMKCSLRKLIRILKRVKIKLHMQSFIIIPIHIVPYSHLNIVWHCDWVLRRVANSWAHV